MKYEEFLEKVLLFSKYGIIDIHMFVEAIGIDYELAQKYFQKMYDEGFMNVDESGRAFVDTEKIRKFIFFREYDQNN